MADLSGLFLTGRSQPGADIREVQLIGPRSDPKRPFFAFESCRSNLRLLTFERRVRIVCDSVGFIADMDPMCRVADA